MNLRLNLALLTGALMLGLVPAMAVAGGPHYQPGGGNEYQPAPGPPAHAKAYGYYCNKQGASKKHVKGQKGTEFSRCVHALKAAHNGTANPRKACKGLSKKHVKGQKGTEFSRCVKAAAKLRRDQRRQEREAAAAKPAAPQGPDYAPAPPSHAKAYGYYCNKQGASKKHVKGVAGTEFSRCVKALAKADANGALAPRQACQGMSKKHVKGQKGTEFSRCVVAAAQLRHDESQV
jgi:hypothetical protein